MQIEKTKNITIGNKSIPVDGLSLNTRKEIEFYDYLRQQLVDHEQSMKVFVTAYSAQQVKVQEMIKAELSPPVQPATTETTQPDTADE